MIRAKRLAFRNAHHREIERMPLYQIERLRIAPKRDGNILRRPPKPSLWRLPHLLFNIFQIYFAHKNQTRYSALKNPPTVQATSQNIRKGSGPFLPRMISRKAATHPNAQPPSQQRRKSEIPNRARLDFDTGGVMTGKPFRSVLTSIFDSGGGVIAPISSAVSV